MRVTSDSGDTEGVTENAVSCLSAHAGQCQKLLHRSGDFAVVLLDDFRAGSLDILGFVAKKAGALDIRLDL